MKVLLATRNKKKLEELRRIMKAEHLSVELLSLEDVPSYKEVPESGATFEENALIKAHAGAKETRLVTIADDSGLALDALNGMPGIFSARWSGRHGDDDANLQLLLSQITDVPDERRAAQFVCAAAVAIPSEADFPATREHVTTGVMPGRIVRTPRGGGGFGYDPIFMAEGYELTNAELSPAQKDTISHRGKAFRQLARFLATMS